MGTDTCKCKVLQNSEVISGMRMSYTRTVLLKAFKAITLYIADMVPTYPCDTQALEIPNLLCSTLLENLTGDVIA